MKEIAELLMVLTALTPLRASALDVDDLISELENTPVFEGSATLSVSLPQSDTDVVYTLKLRSASVPTDSLSPASYLIEWSLPTPMGLADGFTAYFDGNLYRYRDSRLQEYHTAWDSVPFRSTAPGGGVQRSAQFTSLLPQFLGAELRAMSSNPDYTLTLTPETSCNGSKATLLTAERRVDGEKVQERKYFLDPSTCMPLRVVTESNPGSISEQTIIADYTLSPTPLWQPLSEEFLISRYPDLFEKYRESNFRIESMRDTPLPTFALPTTTGDRYLHHRGEAFGSPTVIAIIDPTSGAFNSQLIADVRTAADAASSAPNVIFAFTGTDADAVETLTGDAHPGETMLLNANSLARDCGASALPVVIVTDREGIVKNLVLGFNNNLADVVLQSLELLF